MQDMIWGEPELTMVYALLLDVLQLSDDVICMVVLSLCLVCVCGDCSDKLTSVYVRFSPTELTHCLEVVLAY